MGPGITLVIIGAILALAVRAEARSVDLQVVGVIFMVAGGAIIAWARKGSQRERVVTRVDDPAEPGAPTHTVEEHVIEREQN